MISFKRTEDKSLMDLHFVNLIDDLKQCQKHPNKPIDYLCDDFGVYCRYCQEEGTLRYPEDYLKLIGNR